MPRQIITTANAPSSPLYSQGVKAGSHVLVSGITQCHGLEAILLVLPSALVTMGEEPPEPRSPVGCVSWRSLVPGPGESGEYDIRVRRPLYGRYRLAER